MLYVYTAVFIRKLLCLCSLLNENKTTQDKNTKLSEQFQNLIEKIVESGNMTPLVTQIHDRLPSLIGTDI
jgi:hypothetical protein